MIGGAPVARARDALARPEAARAAVATLAVATAGLLAYALVSRWTLLTQPMLWAGVAGAAVALTALRRPGLLVPLLLVSVPLEISKIYIPILKMPELWWGLSLSYLDAGRLATMLGLVVWLVTDLARGRLVVPGGPVTLGAVAYLALAAASGLWANDARGWTTEIARLGTHLALFLVVARFSATPRRAVAAMWTIVGVTAALAALGIFQQISGNFFWNERLADLTYRRVNGTFADANHLGAALNLGLAVLLALLAGRETLWRWLVALLIPIATAALIFTGSRAGWVVLGLTLAWLPMVGVRTPRGIAIGSLALVVAAAGLVLMPETLDRLANVTTAEALSARPYLIESGLAMFADNPLVGVGLGNFPDALVRVYGLNSPYWGYVTESHTEVVTIGAELGLAGLLLAGGFTLAGMWRLYAVARAQRLEPPLRVAAAGLLIALLGMVVAAQSNGIYTRGPYAWIVLGLAVGLGRAAGAPDRLSGPHPLSPSPSEMERGTGTRGAGGDGVGALDRPRAAVMSSLSRGPGEGDRG